MAHYHQRDPVHAHHPSGRPRPPVSPGDHPAPSVSAQASAARIDCDSCPVAGRGCAGCMVALLGPVRLRLDAAEQAAVDLLVDAGLVEAAEARSAYVEPDLPDWMLQARTPADDQWSGAVVRPSGARTA